MSSKQKSLSFGNYVPNDQVLNKKIPENPRYKHVKPAIDTGKNVRKQIDDYKEKQKNCVYKKDEVFKRLKVFQFIKLVLAVAVELSNNENDAVDQSSNTDIPKASESLERKCLANVLVGIGELDLLNDKKKLRSSMKQVKPMPYLLLDVRDKDAFSKCHIITAKNYPCTMLSRSVSYETEDLKSFKNKQHQIIVICDDDETIATRVAATLVERGYNNIYLLTGGLNLALEICPRGLTTSSHIFSPVHMPSFQAQQNEKEYFTPEDIGAIQHYVDIYPTRGNAAWSQFSPSIKSKSRASSHRSSFDSASVASFASTTSGRSSVSTSSNIEQKYPQSTRSINSRLLHTHSDSSKNIEQPHFKSIIDANTKKPKRPPWK